MISKHSQTSQKYFSIVLAFVFIVVGIFPSNMVLNSFADEAPDFRITSADFKFNGVSLLDAPAVNGPFKNGDLIQFTYNWQIDDEAVILPGSNTLQVTLPDVFPASAEASGPMLDSEGDSYGTYRVANRILTFEFSTEAVRESQVVGGASFSLAFDFEDITVSEPYILTVPFTDTVTKQYKLIVSPADATPSLFKSGSTINSSTTSWQVDANMNLSDTDSLVVFDRLDSRLLFDSSEVEVFPLSVKSDGSYAVSGPKIDSSNYSVDFLASNTSDPHTVSFNIQSIPGAVIPSAYRIVYPAKVDPDKIDFSQSTFTYTNSADFNGANSSASTTIVGGNILSKAELGTNSMVTNPNMLAWKIDVNEASYPLKSTKLEDTIPAGLDFNYPSDLVILDENDADITATLLADSSYNPATRVLSISFGDLDRHRQVQVTTKISDAHIKSQSTFGAQSYYTLSFNNSAKLYQTQNGVESTTTKTSDLTTKVGKLIYKTGTASISYDSAKYIDWKLYVNLANLSTGTSVVNDALDSYQTLPDMSSVAIYPVTVQANGTLVEGAALPSENYTLELDAAQPTQKFKVVFSMPITTPYVIKYRSTIDVEDYNKTSFSNTGTINIGDDINYTAVVNQTIANSFTKSNTDINGDGQAFNYLAKTYDWRLTIRPTREAVHELEIKDSLSSGLYMSTSQLNALIVKKDGAALVLNTDYTVYETLVGGKIKGFVIKFKDDTAVPSVNHVVNNGVYTVDYQATIDPNVLSSNGSLTYSNTAEFDWDIKKDLAPVIAQPNPTLTNLQKYNGSKSGVLDLANKKIKWEINLNYLSKDLSGLVVTDTINRDANGSGLKLVPNSVKLYKDVVNASGSLKTTDLTELSSADLSTAGIIITEDLDANNFEVAFTDEMNVPYRIVYETNLVGISSTNYNNTALTNKGENYSASVTHPQGQTFVDKIGVRAGDFVNWELTINQSKSTIHDVVIKEQLNEGIEIVENSFTLFKGATPLVFSDYFDVVIDPRNMSTSPQSFELRAKLPVEETLTIKYQTAIIVDNIVSNSFSNTATVEGTYLVSGTRTKTKTITHNIMESNGWAIGQLGSFTLTKVDESAQPLHGAKFNFYKGNTLLGQLVSDVDGKIHVAKLKFATYRLEEVEAPSGFQITKSSETITINSTFDQEIAWQNDALRTLQILKYQKGTTTGLLGGVFEVKENNVLVATITTDSDGVATTTLPYGTYEVLEKVAPAGYTKTNVVQQVIIAPGVLNEDSSIKTIYTVVFENERTLEPYVPETTNAPTQPTTEPTTQPVTQPSTSNPKTEPTVETTQGTTEITRENEPKVGEIKVPEGSKPSVKTPPSNGKVEIDENGKWTYTPDSGYTGHDTFKVVLVDPEGNEEEIIIDIEVEETPLGPGLESLPKTGQIALDWMFWIGAILVFSGIFLRQKSFTKL